jgi:arylsulfatase A-like enzyme
LKRREFTRIIGTATTGTILANAACIQNRSGKDSRPNILFIMTDQQSAHMMSCTGNPWLSTPAIDRISAAGVRFENAYACNPVCMPNRFSLQTGLMPSTISMGQNGDGDWSKVTDNMIGQSLGHLFRNAGYESAYGGKVHLPKKMQRLQDLGYQNLTENSRQDLANACVKFIHQKHKKPFFLFASFINPHDICYMAINDMRRVKGESAVSNIDSKTCEKVLDKARNSGDLAAFIEKYSPPLPENHHIPDREPECITRKYTEARAFRDYVRKNWPEEKWRLHRWAYCRLTEMVDKKIGQVLNAVREAGLEDNTLIIFTSDHGDMDSAHKLEHKSVLYEEAVRIPFIMSFKGVIPAGKINNRHLISNGLDLLPTLCDYAGIKIPGGIPGNSIRSIAEGKNNVRWRDHLVVESQNGRMVRTDRYKYCIYDSGINREQLINLLDDPGEMRNLSGGENVADILTKHRQLLSQWVLNNGDDIGAQYVSVNG